jgi:nitronate monooxygenase
LENGYAFCGANAWRTEKIQSVRELIASLRKEYESFSLRDRLFPNKG